MNGYLIVVYVKFTAEEAGRPHNESDSVFRFAVRLVATKQEAENLARREEYLFEEARRQEGFYGGKLGHVNIVEFEKGRITASWQPNYFFNLHKHLNPKKST